MKTTSIHDSIQPSGSSETSASQMLDCLLTPFRAVDRKNWGWEPGPTNVAQDCATGDKLIFLFPKQITQTGSSVTEIPPPTNANT